MIDFGGVLRKGLERGRALFNSSSSKLDQAHKYMLTLSDIYTSEEAANAAVEKYQVSYAEALQIAHDLEKRGYEFQNESDTTPKEKPFQDVTGLERGAALLTPPLKNGRAPETIEELEEAIKRTKNKLMPGDAKDHPLRAELERLQEDLKFAISEKKNSDTHIMTRSELEAYANVKGRADEPSYAVQRMERQVELLYEKLGKYSNRPESEIKEIKEDIAYSEKRLAELKREAGIKNSSDPELYTQLQQVEKEIANLEQMRHSPVRLALLIKTRDGLKKLIKESDQKIENRGVPKACELCGFGEGSADDANLVPMKDAQENVWFVCAQCSKNPGNKLHNRENSTSLCPSCKAETVSNPDSAILECPKCGALPVMVDQLNPLEDSGAGLRRGAEAFGTSIGDCAHEAPVEPVQLPDMPTPESEGAPEGGDAPTISTENESEYPHDILPNSKGVDRGASKYGSKK